MNMKINDLLKTTITILIIFFLTLYISTMSNYQQVENRKQNILTAEAIKQFEEDVANGKEIIASNYLKKEKDYSNKISDLALEISNYIEKIYKKVIMKIFKEIANMIEE